MENSELEKNSEMITDPEVLEKRQEESAAEEFSEKNDQGFNPKLVLFFIVIVSAIGLIFAVIGWFTALKVPFAATGDISSMSANAALGENTSADLSKLQQKDTDLDGLSDYDELYLYKTSPYLSDSDSDGASDLAEVQQNQDPNCPAGQDCGSLSPDDQTTNNSSGQDQLTSEQIRQLLIEGGMSKEQVDSIDDQSLLQLYSETIQETQNNGETSDTFSDLLPADSNLITAEQLRSLLLQEGFNKSDLDNLTDEDLISVWNEVLKSEMELSE